MSYLGYSFQARKIKIVAVLFFYASSDPFFFWKFDLTLTANNSPLKTATLKKYHIFRKPQDVSFPMVPPWIWYSIWKFWVIHVLVCLVFQVFSTAELISLAKTVNLAVWAFSLIFLHDFTLFGIDMHNIYHISSISTTFRPLWNMGFPGPDPNLHLALCHKWVDGMDWILLRQIVLLEHLRC